MLGAIKLHKKEQKTDEDIFAECIQRVNRYQEKHWKYEKELLEYSWLLHNHIMQPHIKDAYDNDLTIKIGLVDTEVKLWVHTLIKTLRNDIARCLKYKEISEARCDVLERLQWLKEIDERFNLEYYKEYEDLKTVLLKVEKLEQKENKKLEIKSVIHKFEV